MRTFRRRRVGTWVIPSWYTSYPPPSNQPPTSLSSASSALSLDPSSARFDRQQGRKNTSCDFGICLCPRSHLHHPSTGQILILYHFLPHQIGKIDVLHAQDDMATQLAVPQLENSMRNHSAKNWLHLCFVLLFVLVLSWHWVVIMCPIHFHPPPMSGMGPLTYTEEDSKVSLLA